MAITRNMQTYILASLHAEYFLDMLSGKKTYEHRDSINTGKLTTPFFIVWYITAPTAGIHGVSACDRNIGSGIPLLETVKLEKAITLSDLRIKFKNRSGDAFSPPQSFIYLEDNMKGLKDMLEERNPSLRDFYKRHPVRFIPQGLTTNEVSKDQYTLEF
jgi:hypothetical protein